MHKLRQASTGEVPLKMLLLTAEQQERMTLLSDFEKESYIYRP